MRARSLDELQVYRKSLTVSVAISSILGRRRLREDLNLCKQMGTASAAVPANIAEGFGQQSDRQFAKYLFIARGSSHEMRAHLVIAHSRSYVDDDELRDLSGRYEEIARMLTGLIKYLVMTDRKQRG
jgi:four helix bundle protein